ncbi:MAG: tyrosine/phenylalanine carboxypeptidase domain-containing protein [Planctomycetota bacterium]
MAIDSEPSVHAPPIDSAVAAELAPWVALDAQLVEVAKSIKVLGRLTWPAKTADDFLDGWRRGNPRLPQIQYPKIDVGEKRERLRQIRLQAAADHPVAAYIRATAKSYELAATMLESVGSPAFTELSAHLYARPSDRVASSPRSHLDVANRILERTADVREPAVSENDYCILPATVQRTLQARADQIFGVGQVRIELDPQLVSKAAAGASRIRIRGATCYTVLDTPQLLEHELLVHTVTMANGRRQPYLRSLGLGAPRTTLTQEGIATFAELITNTMDLNRLRRIALRVQALQLALDGANFIEVFRFFLESGHSESESFLSTARVFRGGSVHGGQAFLKDTVYLAGLLSVHYFLRTVIQENRGDLIPYLFAGRLTLGDVLALAPFFRAGFVQPPALQPDWVRNHRCLSAFLLYSNLAQDVDLSGFTLDGFAK